MSEHAHQAALVKWARRLDIQRQYPGIDLLEGSMNGVKLTKAQAGKAKAAGMLKGSHDVKLPVSRGPYKGLSIEMKFGKNKMTAEQEWYAARLREEGWKVACCWDWMEARAAIIEYLMQKYLFASDSAISHADSGSIIKPIE